MPEIAPLQVQVIAQTQFTPPADVPWKTDADGGQALVEFAGRACYEAWDKPNPATATNRGYVQHLLQVGHLAVLEHSTVTMYLTGLSRAVAAELIRHRHLSFSQLSPRHLPESTAVVVPRAVAGDPVLRDRFLAAVDTALATHAELLEGLADRFVDAPNAPLRRKQARQAARTVLPGALETHLVVTGNYRAWRHFVGMRGSESADPEIREVALACLRALQQVAVNVFDDFRISSLADGSEVAASPFVTEG